MMKMGIFDFLKRSDKHELTQEERELGGDTKSIKSALTRRRQELEMARLELEAEKQRIHYEYEIEKAKQDLEDLQANYEEDDEGGGEDDILKTLLATFITKQQQPAPAAPPAPAPTPQTLEDQQIAQVWRSLSKDHQKIAKRMNDGQLKAIINANLPGISEDSLTRAVEYVRKV
jgi:hypothetical protein